MSDQDIELKLNTIKLIFSHIKNKDIFLWHAQNLLASRLLSKLSLNTEMEKSLISKLKIEVGYNSVRKMETMFKDMENSWALMQHFKDSNLNSEVDINVEVLTNG